MRNLTTRIEQLEAQRPRTRARTHRIIREDDEAQAAALARYELASGIAIGRDDFVILRVIVEPTQEMAA